MQILQTPSFRKAVKRLIPADKACLDGHIRQILAEPGKGDRKKGDLAGLSTIKMFLHGAQFRIAYRFTKERLELVAFGPRENFYKLLK